MGNHHNVGKNAAKNQRNVRNDTVHGEWSPHVQVINVVTGYVLS